ncbi:GGDEF domain-containing protein [Microbacterium sp. NPDC077644]|uniref:GGDEF domain-containing protein n=1 Tax=Microbacterium sp. NPDC077644 TaxID=3155055 RepID=UPI003450F639
MITSTLVMPVIAIATVATIVYIGLGFLPRPSVASACWSAAFAISMVGSYVWLAQDFVFPEQMRAIGSALSIAPMPLLWSGARAYRGRRTFVPIAIAALVATPLFLLLGIMQGYYGIAFRIVFCAAAVFAVLLFVELAKLGPQLRDEALPLMGVTAIFTVFAVITVINGILTAAGALPPSDSLDFLRTLNMIGMTVFIVCALITTLLLTVRDDEHNRSPYRMFEQTARTRLERAQASADPWWSLLDIRLDDPDDIRRASSTAAFNAVVAKLSRDIDSVFPADADIERVKPDCFLILVPRPTGAVRDLLTELLERVSASEPGQPFPLRLSASAGWASVTAAGYNFDLLVQAASDAAVTAHADGGDRWERVRGENE